MVLAYVRNCVTSLRLHSPTFVVSTRESHCHSYIFEAFNARSHSSAGSFFVLLVNLMTPKIDLAFYSAAIILKNVSHSS
jgi:hypothetical protein